MQKYRFHLEKYNGTKTRHNCPNCEKRNVFTRYLNIESNEYVNEKVGMCSRMIKCGYHYTPKSYFTDNDIKIDKSNYPQFIPMLKPKPKTTYIDAEVMINSLKNESNNFIDYLTNHWNTEIAQSLAKKYHIGNSKHWNGATIFWQVDINKKIRSGKIMLYNPTNGKRIKEPYNHINWIHKVMKIENFNLEQCYFGEHILNTESNKPVAIVESEKTAIIASVYLPEFIWLACGSANNLNEAKTRCLKGRSVVLFPDLGCYDLWNDKIPSLTKLATFTTSTLLRDKASSEEKNKGLDIADYLIQF